MRTAELVALLTEADPHGISDVVMCHPDGEGGYNRRPVGVVDQALEQSVDEVTGYLTVGPLVVIS